MKKISKKALINNIINYVFNTYCDDEQIAIFLQQYYEIEKKLEEKRHNNKNISSDKDKKYKITKSVRDFIEPLIDAEYFKMINYSKIANQTLYDAMEQLQTKMYKQLLKEIDKKESK